MTDTDRTPSVVYRQLDWISGYRFGSDGTCWSRRKCCRWGQLAVDWRQVHMRRKPSGHLSIRVTIDGKKTAFHVHRLILEAFVGPCPEGMECCHNDGNPVNNRLDNLRWDTKKANVEDSKKHGTFRRAKGSRQHKAKLVESDIPVIRLLSQGGLDNARIGREYGVTRASIRSIITGETWKHVP